nr:MAG TPA: hypothetical protein [Bacteriophage sp.]
MFSRTLKYISRYITDISCLHIPPPHLFILFFNMKQKLHLSCYYFFT